MENPLARSVAFLLVVVALLALAPLPLRAWGLKGHEIQARIAVAALPTGMPAFFRDSSEELAFLITEPDRWRTSEQPALTETNGVNHTFKYELAPRPLPRNRHQFLIELVKSGKVGPADGAGVRDFGTSPYGIQEWTEMLTAAFRRWRAMPETTPAETARKRMHERSILFMAGVLGHWVTDSSQPMHASIHVHGWHRSVPNPQGYVGKDLHSRFESRYVDRAIELADVAPLVEGTPRLLGDWLREAETHVAAANAHVEQIYRWDLQAPFGGGNEPAEAKPFTAARLADGARMLRDAWHTAWVRSGAPTPKFEANAASR